MQDKFRREIANIPAEQSQRVSQNLFHWHEECLRVEEQHFQHLLWSVNCNFFIPNIIRQQVHWFISKIHICLAAGSALAAMNHSTMNRSTKVSTFLSYIVEPDQLSWYSNWLHAGRQRSKSSCPSRVTNFLFTTSFKLALGPTQPHIQWVPELVPRAQSGRGLKLTTHLQLVSRSRKCRSIHPLPHMASWRSA
jgi:hypothetical protein